MTRLHDAEDSLVSWSEIQDVELVIVRRMQEFAIGSHPSMFHGTGHDLAGLRDFQPGDRLSTIDWPQSTLTNFSPLVTREFDQECNAPIVVAADVSQSTRCGVGSEPIAKVIARAVATFAMAASFFQDRAGLVTFDRHTRRIAVRPRIGKNHAIHCVAAYQEQLMGRGATESAPDVSFAGLLRKRSLVPVISDFLFEESEPLLNELADLKTAHDVFLVMIDSAFAFELPQFSAGWVEAYDVETGQTRVISSGDVAELGTRVAAWQDTVERAAHDHGLEVLRLGGSGQQFHDTLVAFLLERRQLRR
ncbi:MAG: DUF58 domain-containing protein [Vicinamibacterales bacterium]|jgi:uncharacterized protein (DUF58 family)|nr:DUF58 domain-containing protein [Vicinamibacterales bacterium]